jgi:hypothetical protein
MRIATLRARSFCDNLEHRFVFKVLRSSFVGVKSMQIVSLHSDSSFKSSKLLEGRNCRTEQFVL